MPDAEVDPLRARLHELSDKLTYASTDLQRDGHLHATAKTESAKLQSRLAELSRALDAAARSRSAWSTIKAELLREFEVLAADFHAFISPTDMNENRLDYRHNRTK